MHPRSYVIVLAGILTNLWLIFAVITPLVSTGYPYWYDRPQKIALQRSGGTILPSIAPRLNVPLCGWYEPFYIVDYWTPQLAQIAALEQELPIYLGAFAGRGDRVDSLVRGAARTPRQYSGITHFFDGGLILVTGYEVAATGRAGERFISQCDDIAWRWSAEFDPRSGHFVHLNLTRSGEW